MPTSSKPAAPAIDETTATRETGETTGGETTERATTADAAAEQRDGEPEAPEELKNFANGSLFGPPEDGIASPDAQRAATVAALLRERSGYATHGKADRVKAVDAELKRLGHKA